MWEVAVVDDAAGCDREDLPGRVGDQRTYSGVPECARSGHLAIPASAASDFTFLERMYWLGHVLPETSHNLPE